MYQQANQNQKQNESQNLKAKLVEYDTERLRAFSARVRRTIAYTQFLSVWEGSVRSSKTIASLMAWLMYVMNHKNPKARFLMSGHTLASLSRNCIEGDMALLWLSGGIAKFKQDSKGNHVVKIFDKTIYCAGASDKSSYKPFTGVTIEGWYADEVNLHHMSFIKEMFNRSIAATDRRNMWTMNPEPPGHELYTTYIDKYLYDKVPGYRWHHFTLQDNPAISKQRRIELESQVSGTAYQRAILGRRVRSEGAIYENFKKRHILKAIPRKMLDRIVLVEMGVDIGETISATAFSLTAYTLGYQEVITIAEHYDKDNINVDAIVINFKNFVTKWKKIFKHKFTDVYVDSAAALLIKSFNFLGLPVRINKSYKLPIIQRILLLDQLQTQNRYYIMETCTYTIEALTSAVWDKKASNKSVRLDDGSTPIDPLDAMEYTIEQHRTALLDVGMQIYKAPK